MAQREINGPYRKELKTFYKAKYESSMKLAEYDHYFFHEDWDNYLANISYNIASNNGSYDFSRIQPVFSTYFWPNAYSVGEGTIVINPGIMPHLDNEQQLAFILCHEFAHYILNHTERQYVGILENIDSEEFEREVDNIRNSHYYQNTQIKKLLRSRFYETRKHTRSLEMEADSLGLIFFKNAGYDVNEALTTLQALEKISGKIDYDLDISAITKHAKVDYADSDLLANASNSNDSWLDLDSMKTHPDCSRRFTILCRQLNMEESFESFKTDYQASTSFKQIKQELTYFIIECYLKYDRIDMALLTIWHHQKNGDDNLYLKKKNFIALADMVYARKNHKAGHVFTFPNDSMATAQHDLNSMIFGMRYKEFVDVFYNLAMEAYDESFTGEEYLYALIKLAYAKGDREGLSAYKADYFTQYDRISGKYYQDIKYLR